MLQAFMCLCAATSLSLQSDHRPAGRSVSFLKENVAQRHKLVRFV